jgi:hypothetical protein
MNASLAPCALGGDRLATTVCEHRNANGATWRFFAQANDRLLTFTHQIRVRRTFSRQIGRRAWKKIFLVLYSYHTRRSRRRKTPLKGQINEEEHRRHRFAGSSGRVRRAPAPAGRTGNPAAVDSAAELQTRSAGSAQTGAAAELQTRSAGSAQTGAAGSQTRAAASRASSPPQTRASAAASTAAAASVVEALVSRSVSSNPRSAWVGDFLWKSQSANILKKPGQNREFAFEIRSGRGIFYSMRQPITGRMKKCVTRQPGALC